MKSYVNVMIMLLLVGLTVPSMAQDKTDKKAQRQAKKAVKKVERAETLEANRAHFLDLIQNQAFVIEADQLRDRRLNHYEVSRNTNFVAIEGNDAVVQFGFNHLIGRNGLGGRTFDGKLTNFEVKDSKKNGPIVATGQLVSPGLLGATTLVMRVFDDGRAEATVTSAFGSRLTFSGYINDLEDSYVYKGIPQVSSRK